MGRGTYIKPGRDSHRNTWVVFSPVEQDKAGLLSKAIDIFKVRGNMKSTVIFIGLREICSLRVLELTQRISFHELAAYLVNGTLS